MVYQKSDKGRRQNANYNNNLYVYKAQIFNTKTYTISNSAVPLHPATVYIIEYAHTQIIYIRERERELIIRGSDNAIIDEERVIHENPIRSQKGKE